MSKDTPKSEYARIKKDNSNLLKLIGKELEKFTVEEPCWGDVGSIGHARERLKELLSCLRNPYDEAKMHHQIELELKNAK